MDAPERACTYSMSIAGPGKTARWSVRRQRDVTTRRNENGRQRNCRSHRRKLRPGCFEIRYPRAGGFLGNMVRPLPRPRPIVDELAKDYQGKLKVGKMDVDANSSTPMRYKVTGIPTLLIFKGGQVVEQLVGYRPKDALAQAIDKHVG